MAIDFDNTLVCTHTGGQYIGEAEDLAKFIRQIFTALIPLCLESNIKVSIVTFSPQVQLIRDTLIYYFGKEVASKISIRGLDGSWTYGGESKLKSPAFIIMQMSSIGKQLHMESVIDELNQGYDDIASMKYGPNTTLLLDDDYNNIAKAMGNDYQAVWFRPGHNGEERTIDDLINFTANRKTQDNN